MPLEKTPAPRRPPTLALVLLVLTSLLGPVPTAGAAGDAPVDAAVDRLVAFVRSAQEDDGAFRSGLGDTGTFLTWQAIVALSAAGVDPWEVRTGPDASSAMEWLRENRVLYGTQDTPWQRQILAIAAAGEDPSRFAGYDYVQRLREDVENGRTGSEHYLNEEMFALFAFRAAGVGPDDPDVKALRETLERYQNADGSWGSGLHEAGNTDMTGAGVAALVAAGAPADSERVRDAVTWLASAQVDAGGFSMEAGGAFPNIQSTAWAVWGLRSAGEDVAGTAWRSADGVTPVAWLADLVDEDGRVDGRGYWEAIDVLLALTAPHYPVRAWLPVDPVVVTDAPLSLEPVVFRDDGPATRHLWDFGDGTALLCTASGCVRPDGDGTVVSEVAAHAYARPGAYTVTVRAWDDGYGFATATVTVDVASQPPVAALEATATRVERGKPVTFSALASADPDGRVDAYRWDFGDGTTRAWGTSAVVDHAFDALGTFNVTVHVRDDSGLTHVAHTPVEVVNAPPVVTPLPDVTADRVTPVTFTAAATDPDAADDALAYTWTLGDGTEVEGRTVTHTYATLGSFDVQLTVRDADGGHATTGFTVSVRNLPPTVGNLTWTPAAPEPGETVRFSLEAADPEGTALAFTWDLAGATADTTHPETTHVFDAPGEHPVRVTVADAEGGSATRTVQVPVAAAEEEAPPATENEPDASEDEEATPPPEEAAPVTVILTAPQEVVPILERVPFTVDGAPAGARYRFDFGDGNGTAWQDAPEAAHRYAAPGHYEASVTVTEGDGEWTARALVTVENAPPRVSITSPANGTDVSTDVVTLRGRAWDADGRVDRVQVWAGGTAAAVTGTTEWVAHLNLAHAEAGEVVVVRARATDDLGRAGPEATVHLVVAPPVIVHEEPEDEDPDARDAQDEEAGTPLEPTTVDATGGARDAPAPAALAALLAALAAAGVRSGGARRRG